MPVRGSLSGSPERRRRARTAVTAVVAMVAALLVPVLGQVAPASAATTSTIATAEYPIGIAEDSEGNIYLGDSVDGVPADVGLTVVPANSGTLFGQAVSSNVEHTLVTQASLGTGAVVQGVAVHPTTGDVFFTTSTGNVYVLPKTSGTVFGRSVTANTPSLIETNAGFAGGIDFDSAGNLYGADEATDRIVVLAVATGTLFGVPTFANNVSILDSTGTYWWWDVAVDGTGNLLLTSGWSASGVYILPKVTASNVYGEATVTINTLQALSKYSTQVGSTYKPAGVDVASNGTIYASYWSSFVSALSPTTTTLFGTSVTANTATELTASNSPVTNQGVMLASNGDLITGGSSHTYRINSTGKPTGVVALAATPSETSVALSWTAPGDNGGLAITDYTVQYQTVGAGSWTTFGDVAGTSATVTGLSAGTAYTFRVAGKNSNGTGTWATVPGTTTSPAPSGGGGGGSSSSSTTSSTTSSSAPAPTESSAPVVPTTAPEADPANAGLKLGTVNVLIGGQQTQVTSQGNKAGGTVSVTGNGWSTTAGSQSGSSPVPLTPGGALNLQTGKQATINVAGFSPGSTLGVSLLSTPVSLGTVAVDAAGAASASLTIPSSVPAGRHTLQVNGYSSNGELRSVAFGVVVSKAKSTAKATVKRGTVTFEPNSSTLSSADKKKLSAMVARIPKAATISAVSVGYAYGSNSDGSAETLAKARAKSVLTYVSDSRKLASSKATGKVLPATGRPGQATLTLTYS